MPLFPSDFKKFKHVSSDDTSTILRHEKGHELKIAHKALSPAMRKQLEALAPKMASGGDVVRQAGQQIKDAVGAGKIEQDYGMPQQSAAAPIAPDSNGDIRTPEQKAKAAEFEQSGMLPVWQPHAEGGEVQKYAEGEMVQPQQSSVSEQEQMNPEMVRKRDLYNNLVKSNTVMANDEIPVSPETQAFGAKGEAPQNFSPKNWAVAEQMYQKEKATNAADIAQTQQQAIKVNESRVAAGLQPIPVPNVPEGPQIPGSSENPTAATPPEKSLNPTAPSVQAQPAGSMDDTMGMMQKGFQSQMSGIQQEAAAKSQQGEQQAQALQQAAESQATAKAAYQQHYNELEQERQHLVKDVQDGHVDPDKFWTGDKDGNGGHSKIASAIGMIIAGFNPTNSPNAAINFLKFQMEQNLNAQKDNLSSKQNLLSANLRQFGNLKDAMEMTRIQQNDIIQNQLQQAAAKATSPMAKAAALQAAGQLQMQAAPMFQQFAMKRAMMNMANNGSNPGATEQMLSYMRVTNPEMAKEMEGRYVPGIGLASVPVPEKVREQLATFQQADSTIKDLQKFVKTHSTIIPGTPDYNVGQQKSLALQSLVRESKLGTVYREGEQPLLDKFVSSNPAGALKMFKTEPQLSELLQSNMRNYNIIRKQYGFPAQQAAPEVVTGKDGKQYQKVGNYMVPVR